jgi:hypothetical protein
VTDTQPGFEMYQVAVEVFAEHQDSQEDDQP